jgi:L-threonylcarbamoyladenylate synthase
VLRQLDAAVEALSAGLVVAVPTDTVYGLAALPSVPGATERLFVAKGRPRSVELPVLVDSVEAALGLCVESAVPPAAHALMAAFWPGPLTLVLPRRPGLGYDLGSDEATIGVRCPGHAVPRQLCSRVGPLATTSANRHGEPPPVAAPDVASLFGPAVAVVIDGGECSGAASTVVDCTGVEVKCLREGRVPWADVLSVVGAGLS